MKRLTAEEIADLREWSRAYAEDQPPLEINHAAMGGEVDRVNASIVGNAIPRLLDEVERSRALLKRIEWKAEGRRCPACHGLFDRWADGDTIEVTQEEEQHGFGHRPGCELAAPLAP